MVPQPLDLRPASEASSRLPIRSPRQHVAGEAPPELSPLDAFALQSRILARQLGEANPRNGRRVSRLPPLNAKSPLIVQARSDYFRSISMDSIHSDQSNPEEHHSDGLGLRTEVEDPGEERPVSVHPGLSGIPPPASFVDVPVPPIPREILEREKPSERKGDALAFGATRAPSPKPMDNPPAPTQNAISAIDTIQVPSTKAVLDASPTIREYGVGVPSPERLSRQSEFESLGLAPPRPPFQNRSSSGMSSLETTDEEGPSPMTSSLSSLPPRKLSFNGNPVAAPQLSPGYPPTMGSPSIGADGPISSPRPFNFSRPMSRVSTPVQEYPFPRTPHEGSFFPADADETGTTPRSVTSEAPDNNMVDGKAAPSYVYSKFTLPRGKDIRHSLLRPDIQIYDLWDQASSQVHGAPPSPPVRPGTSESQGLPSDFSLKRPSADQSSNVGPAPQPSPNPSLPSTEGGQPYMDEDASRGRTLSSRTHDEVRGKTAMSISTQDSRSTIKPSQRPLITPTSISEMTAEQHLAKGIECHESGSLSKSTYHLRLAARQHHPTAMLLYALACRHGWGMRVNEKEGVEWLRKAAEYAGLEIADDEGQQKDGKEVDLVQAKTRKAQFALSIYELGVSHMNGWGIEQDRALALRCFEIASSWGDVDALAEAGYCYAQGMGCKKDLKKAAKFYRQAEAKGMSMVGNSWIHKAKYDDEKKDQDRETKKSRSKSRTRSRTRSLFGSKRPTTSGT